MSSRVYIYGQYQTSQATWPDGSAIPMQTDNKGNTIVVSGGSGTTADQVQGSVASGSADSGNPVKIGAKYNATLPTFADLQRGDLQIGTRGSLNTTLFSADTNVPLGYVLDNADAIATSATVNKLTAAAYPYVYNGSTRDRQRGDTNGTVTQAGLSSTFWRYTSGSSPILSNTTTAVTIASAAGVGVRNYIDSIQLTTTAFTASVPLAIRDGASGTVIWALVVPTGGFLQGVTMVFPSPLKGTANTLLEVVTTTANTAGTVTFNCQGHTGA